ncbi:MAG: transcriptional repressor [Rhodospirillales bacterium]|jgi:Fur family zinc uptake transcriptional regulator|nr:transcriptional repressor [Rhodospirillales bacterium]MDE2582592.1 transcriptional repressor [Rhodospirillales bacterium]
MTQAQRRGRIVAEAGFSLRTERLLARADTICAARGVRLTALRRDVLGLILEAETPAGAYDLLDRLRRARGKAAPPTVYRALDFLCDQGLVHRVERLAAFVGCVAPPDPDAAAPEPHAHAHAAQFLICRRCGRAIELEDPELAHALAAAAARRGFAVRAATIEAEGVCAACAAAPVQESIPCP